jgi:hypothetical protein
MKKYYGIDDPDMLQDDAEDAVINYIECDLEDVSLDDITWPLVVDVYEPMKIPAGTIDRLAHKTLGMIIDELDEEYADHDTTDSTMPTPPMIAAAKAFAAAVVAEYVPWACEKTGEKIEYTREMAELLL